MCCCAAVRVHVAPHPIPSHAHALLLPTMQNLSRSWWPLLPWMELLHIRGSGSYTLPLPHHGLDGKRAANCAPAQHCCSTARSARAGGGWCCAPSRCLRCCFVFGEGVEEGGRWGFGWRMGGSRHAEAHKQNAHRYGLNAGFSRGVLACVPRGAPSRFGTRCRHEMPQRTQPGLTSARVSSTHLRM